MYYAKLLRVALVALSVTTVVHANSPEKLKNGRPADGAVVRRQGTATEDDPPNSTPPPSNTPTPSNPPDDDDEETTSTPTRTTPSTSRPTQTTTTGGGDDPETTNTSQTSEEPITETFTEIITTTNADGQPTAFTTESTVTRTPGLSQGNSGGASGMTKETRNIVIGVVVGVGGAIVLGALGFVAWRIWGRKRQAEEQDILMYGDKHDGGSSPGGTVGTAGTARNPFQSTLENYHAPTHVNASSNF